MKKPSRWLKPLKPLKPYKPPAVLRLTIDAVAACTLLFACLGAAAVEAADADAGAGDVAAATLPTVTEPAPQAATVLRFRDFYQSPIGPAGLQMSRQLLAAHGLRVSLTGYMVTQETPLRGHFFLTPLPLSMSTDADGEADDLPPAHVLVQLPAADAAVPVLTTPGLLQLTGRLQVGRFEMADGRVVWLRLLLEPRSP